MSSASLAEALESAAYISGRQIGLQGLPSSSVQGQPGTPEHEEGLRGWRSVTASDLAYEDAMRTVA